MLVSKLDIAMCDWDRQCVIVLELSLRATCYPWTPLQASVMQPTGQRIICIMMMKSIQDNHVPTRASPSSVRWTSERHA